MKRNRPFFLISNDDGYMAKGINELIDTLRTVADLLVVAPERPRSGMGCAITADVPVTCQLVRKERGLKVYSCSGTPADCIKLAHAHLLKNRRPDLVLAGINHGDNSSVNAHYSGTMGAVYEGALHGYPSVAFSLCDHNPDADFTMLRPYIIDLVFKAITVGMPSFTCLNVNFPKCGKFKGVKICRMGYTQWENEFTKAKRPQGGTVYWLTGDRKDVGEAQEDTDSWALDNGYVAITPVTLDVTSYGLLDILNNVF